MNPKRFSEVLERLSTYVTEEDPKDKLEQTVLVLERIADDREARRRALVSPEPRGLDKHQLTVGKLRKLLEDVPEDTPVLGRGHFGEGVRMDECSIELRKHVQMVDLGWSSRGEGVPLALLVGQCDIGPEPD